VSMDPEPRQATRPAASAVLSTRAVPRSPLFNEAPPGPLPAAARSSLFGIVTGVIRRSMPVATPEPARSEPAPPAAPAPAASVQPTVTDEMGLDIPAFLRRQTS